ncbi:MAG: PD-(D/E)XK nuclease-like domain-containing protein [Phycisphaeraceae bacterium]|nr:PD-(D/E)XK nuclease-like domain-containing protein [Phycisphaerales bacterium]MCB9858857.1 PD-(D/E)XK nuclease-like domain-containing protein [Phycisphaeraceae bacterium]
MNLDALKSQVKDFTPELDARGRCEAPEPGIYRMDFPTYKAIEGAVNANAIKQGVPENGTPRHMHADLNHAMEKRDTDALRNGRRLHTLVLEPELAERWVSMPQAPKSTKDGLAKWVDAIEQLVGEHITELHEVVGTPPSAFRDLQGWVSNAYETALRITGSDIVPEEQRAMLDEQAKALRTHELCGRYLAADGLSEVTVIWDKTMKVRDYTTPNGFVEKTLRMKARLDRLVMHAGKVYSIDIKTAANGGLAAFTSAACNNGYDIAAAHYREAVGFITGQHKSEPRLLVCENRNGLYTASVKVFGDRWLDAADARRMQVLRLYASCLHIGKMPGHGWEWATDGTIGRYTAEVMEPPYWMIENLDKNEEQESRDEMEDAA